jgi:hypothetical protein
MNKFRPKVFLIRAQQLNAAPGSKFSYSDAGLPDGLFSTQKSKFGQIFERLRLENVVIFYGHPEYFVDIWDIP